MVQRGTWLRAILTAAVAATPLCAQTPTPAAPTAPPSANTGQGEVDRLIADLADASVPQTRRDQAARRLVSRGTDPAKAALLATLLTPNPAGQLAAARALCDAASPDDRYVDALFYVLSLNNAAPAQAAGTALARYKNSDRVIAGLINSADDSRAESTRVAAIRALGAFPEKRAASTLIGILTQNDNPDSARNAAADALSALSGRSDIARDPQLWRQWWSDVSRQPDLEFRNNLLSARFGNSELVSGENAQLSAELDARLREAYAIVPQDQQTRVLVGWLNSEVPDTRRIAAAIARDEKLNGQPLDDSVIAQLRVMIGDSSPKVRLQAADTLANINDGKALEALLAQLRQETDPNIKAAMIRAVAPIRDLSAVPPLLEFLRDSSLLVQQAAADAIAKLGPDLQAKNPAVAAQAAGLLQTILDRPADQTPALLRESAIDALVPLKSEFSRLPLLKLVNDPSPRIRVGAINALAELGNTQSADQIQNRLSSDVEREPRVRRAALIALKRLASDDYYRQVLARMNPRNESDESVRQQAWDTLVSLMPIMKEIDLEFLSDQLSSNPDQQRLALLCLCDKYSTLMRANDLAKTYQTLGQVYEKLAEYKDAAEVYQKALTLYDNPAMVRLPITLEQLRVARVNSLMRARNFPEAVVFAKATINNDPDSRQTMGEEFKKEAERLTEAGKTDSKSADDAKKLIEEAAKIELAPRFTDSFKRCLDRIANYKRENGVVNVPDYGLARDEESDREMTPGR